jgi:hypothetical protein
MQSTPQATFLSSFTAGSMSLSGRVAIIILFPLILLIGMLIINLIIVIG